MNQTQKLFLWSSVALVVGGACGYLYSSRFCRITLVRRVEKGVALNQTLRRVLAEHAFWIHNYIHSVFFNAPDQQAVHNRLLKTEEHLGNIFQAYYGARAQERLVGILRNNTSLVAELVQATKSGQRLNNISSDWKKNTQALAKLLSQLNPDWGYTLMKYGLDEQLSLITKEIKALHEGNWEQSIKIFDSHFEYAMLIADELDQGILKQFPNKF